MGGWNGSGSVTLDYDWTNDRDAGIPIDADRMDAQQEALRGAIQNTIAKDGQNSPTANLPMGGNRHTGVGNASARNDYAAAGQVQDGAFIKGTAGGTADALTLTLSPAITAYAAGQVFVVRAGFNNATTTPTLNVNGVGAKTIKKYTANALVAGDIVANRVSLIAYDAGDDSFSLLNPMSAENFVENAIANVSEDTSPQAGGTFDLNGHDIILTKGGDIASASPLVIDTDGSYFDVTGITGFSAMTVAAGAFFALQFDGALTITHGSGITLPGGENITTVAGDQALCYATAANTVTVISYVRASVSPVPMTQAQAEAGTDTVPRPVAAAQIKQAIDALASSGITAGTSQASTSGTAINFTSIPSGTEQIIITFHGVSLSGLDQVLVQIGDSGGLETTSYVSSTRSASGGVTSTSGFIVHRPAVAASLRTGHITLTRRTGNVWISSHVMHDENDNSENSFGGGSKTLSAELDRLTITRTGTDTFDAGNINIHYL